MGTQKESARWSYHGTSGGHNGRRQSWQTPKGLRCLGSDGQRGLEQDKGGEKWIGM